MGDVPEHVKRRWAGIKHHNKVRQRQKEKRRKRVSELWFTGQFTRKDIALLCKVCYKTICRDIAAINEMMEEASACFVCGGPVHTIPNRRVLAQSAAEHRRIADILEGKG